MAELDSAVVKSYDIRGTYPDQVDERFAFLLGRALARVLPCERAAVGCDSRLSSPSLYAALAAGFERSGVGVSGLGLCPTELVYYVLGADSGFDLGVMVTASHNPPEYNGFKVVKAGGEPVTGATGLDDAFHLMQGMEADGPLVPRAPMGRVEAGPDYMDFALGLVGEPEVEGLRVVADAGNGVGGLLWALIEDRLGLEPVKMNFEPDGSFPAHHPDPSRTENLAALVERVVRAEADAGFAYDGDADRVVVVMPDGHVVDGSEMTACIAHRMLARDPACAFGVGQTTSRKVLDWFRARGVEPLIVPVGHAKIKAVLRAEGDLVFAGENAGHYYYRDFFCCDSSLLTTLHLLHLASSGELGGLVGGFAGPWHRPEREPKIEFDDQGRALEVCRRVALAALEEYPGPVEVTCETEGRVLRRCERADVLESDGVRVDYGDWWFCVRPSGTEPIARLSLEARSAALLQERMDRLLALFERHRKDDGKVREDCR